MAIHKDDWELFLNEARLELPGASDMGIKQMLFSVLEEFCQDSSAWRENLTVAVIAGNATTPNTNYTLIPQDGGYIIRLIGAFDANNIPQPAFLPDSIPTLDGGPLAQGQLQFVNPTNQNQNFTVIVAKQVSLPTSRHDAPVFSDHLFKRYRRWITDGVVGKMMQQMNKPYSNMQAGAQKYLKFRQGVNMARTQAARQNTMGAQGWAYPQGWRMRTQKGGVSVANPTTFD